MYIYIYSFTYLCNIGHDPRHLVNILCFASDPDQNGIWNLLKVRSGTISTNQQSLDLTASYGKSITFEDEGCVKCWVVLQLASGYFTH